MYGYGNYGGMMGNYGGGGWIAMFIIGFLCMVAVVVFVIWLARGASHHGPHHPSVMSEGPAPLPPLDKTPTPMDAHEEAVAIAKKRLANGEIDATEYTRIMEALHQETVVR